MYLCIHATNQYSKSVSMSYGKILQATGDYGRLRQTTADYGRLRETTADYGIQWYDILSNRLYFC